MKITITDLVAIILASGLVVALNLFIVAAIVESYANPITLPVGLSDNATQVLTGWGGGIVGIIGALVGIRVGRHIPTPDTIPVDRPPEGAD